VTYNHERLLDELDALLQGNPGRRLSEIARLLRVSRHTIEQVLRANRKMTFREYKYQVLLRTALERLDIPNLSIKEIGISLGYTSAASFSRFIQK